MYISLQNDCKLEKTLVKLNLFSLIKDGELLEKYSEIWETVKDSLKNSLIVNQNTKKKKISNS